MLRPHPAVLLPPGSSCTPASCLPYSSCGSGPGPLHGTCCTRRPLGRHTSPCAYGSWARREGVFQSPRLRELRELWVLWEDTEGKCGLTSPLPCSTHRLSDSAFNSLRLWVLVALCLLRLSVTRPHLQAYLCLAKSRVEQLRREAGCIEAREIQQRVWVPVGEGAWGVGCGFQSFWPGVSPSPKGHLPLLPAHQVVRVYCYVTVVSLQYLTPLILTLNCTLLLKTLGERELPLGRGWG